MLGQNDENQLPPTTLTDTFVEIAAGEMVTCARRANQSVICWGVGFPQPTGLFTAIDANTDFACGIHTDGTAVCWDSSGEHPVPM